MLQNSFYTISQLDKHADSLAAKIIVNPDHEIFKGHFPSQPVVPGVCMVQIIKELLEDGAGANLIMHSAAQIKFLQLLMPEKNQEIQAEISWREENGAYLCKATLKKNDQAIFKMNAGFIKK